MKRIWILLALVFGLGWAQETDPPRLRVRPEGVQNLGSVGPREKKALEYRLQNQSASPIRLHSEDVPPGLSVEGPALEAPIEAGTESVLRVLFDASAQRGWFRKKVRLRTDDPRQGRYVLPIEATIRPDLSVDAARKAFPTLRPGESSRLVYRFVRETGDPIQLRLLDEPPAYLKAGVQANGAQAELSLAIEAAALPPGRRRGLETLRIGTNVPDQAEFALYASWEAIPVLRSDPEHLVFRRQDRLEVRLSRPDGAAFKLEEVDLRGEDLELLEHSSGSATVHRLVLGRRRAARTSGELRIRIKGDTRGDIKSEKKGESQWVVLEVSNLPE